MIANYLTTQSLLLNRLTNYLTTFAFYYLTFALDRAPEKGIK